MRQLESLLPKHIGNFFTKYLSAERGASSNTIRAYALGMSQFIEYLEVSGKSTAQKASTAVLTRVNVLDYLSWLETERSVSVSTRNHRLAVIHSFCRYMMRADITHMDRWQDILSIKSKKGHPKQMLFLSVEGMKLLLQSIPTDNIVGRRDLAMIALLYDSAARVNELINLRPCDLHLGSPAYIVLHGKGNKNRSVPLQDNEVSLLKKYIEENQLDRPELQTEPLFKNRNGSRLTGAGVTYLLMKYVTSAHAVNPELVPKSLSPHSLRHSKAMHLLQAGVNLVYIRDILGHSSIITTEIYARADSKQKREALEAAYKDVLPTSAAEAKPIWQADKSLKEWLKNLGKR